MNVDVLETIDLYQKLRARGVDVRALILPGEAHDMVRHASWLNAWDKTRQFFAEKLRKGRLREVASNQVQVARPK